MKTIPIYQIDAFAAALFQGNPAAVCPLEEWLGDATLQAIAAENNLSETAFIVGGSGHYQIRWFTPQSEVDLCGHATLASAHVVFEQLESGRASVTFDSKSGPLQVSREGELLVLDFPAREPTPMPTPDGLAEALGRAPRETLRSRDLICVFDNEREVRDLVPDFARLRRLDAFAVIVTAPGISADFVSRFFAPAAGIDEDPVTGSAHCTLIPYWARRLGRERLRALQVSARGGELICEYRGDRVRIGGRAIPYLEGTIRVPTP